MALTHIDRSHAECGGFAHDGNRKMFFFVPFNGMGRNLGIGKITRHIADGDMVLTQSKKLGHLFFIPWSVSFAV